MGKGEIPHYEQFLLFSKSFQKTFTTDKLFGRGLKVRNHYREKKETVTYQNFYCFPKCFEKFFSLGSVKLRLCCKDYNFSNIDSRSMILPA